VVERMMVARAAWTAREEPQCGGAVHVSMVEWSRGRRSAQ